MFETKKYIFKTDFYIVSETPMLRNRYFLAFLNQSLPVIFQDLPILRYDTVLFYASAIFLYKKLQLICVKLPHYTSEWFQFNRVRPYFLQLRLPYSSSLVEVV